MADKDHQVHVDPSNTFDNLISGTTTENKTPISTVKTEKDASIVDLTEEDRANNEEDNNRSKSIVWKYFEKKTFKGEATAQCTKCKNYLTAKTGSGTSHLRKHAKKCFGSHFRQIDIHQMVLKKNHANAQVSNYTYDPKIAREELGKMVVMHEYPLCMVDHIGFRNFVAAVQPLFKVPTRNTLKHDLLRIYELELVKTKKLIEKNTSRIAITTDMWTADHQKKGYMAITGHFVDSSWRLQSRILRFIHVPTPHTSDVLAGVLIEGLLDWNVDNKVSTITLDNCSTNDAMIYNILEKLDRDKLIRNRTLLHMRCCAHILNLIVRDGLEMIKDEDELIRSSVVYWTATPKRIEKFEEAARQLRIACTKKLTFDCPTRWNSTYLMLNTALIYKDVFPRLKKIHTSYTSLPNEEQWQIATEICSRLAMFNDVSQLFSGTDYVTANLYFPKICEIKLSLDSWFSSSSIIIRTMASSMLSKFDKYWGVVHDVMSVAAVLDPRYKMTLLEFYFPRVYGDKANSHMTRIRELCYDLVSEYQMLNMVKTESGGTMDCDNANSVGGSLSEYDYFVRSKKKLKSSVSKSELGHYLEEFVLPRAENFDILSWWQNNGLKYPTLQIIARDVLCIPVSSVASEFTFSTGGRVVSVHRNRLHPKTLEALMCLQNWLRETMKKDSVECANSVEYASVIDDVDNEVLDAEEIEKN